MGFPFLHGFLNIEFFDSPNFSLPVFPNGTGEGASRPTCGHWVTRLRWPHSPAISLSMASLSPGGSSRTCPTTHWTKSPTSSSWSKSWNRPQPLLPSFPAAQLFLPPHTPPHPQTTARKDLSPWSSCLSLIGQKSWVGDEGESNAVFSPFFQERSGAGPVFPKADAGELKGEETSG